MSTKNQYLDLENDIKSCIRMAISKTDSQVFQSLNDVFKTHFEKPCNNITEIRTKNTRQKGLVFEVFCKMYLLARGYDNVWMLSELPSELRTYLSVGTFDIGIDLIARIKIPNTTSTNLDDYFYIAVQAKYRKPTKNALNQTVHRVGWKELSTFLSIVTRSGPPKGWFKHMVITNADYVSWKGKKTKKDFTYAKKTFEKCSNIFWLKMIKSVVNIRAPAITQKNDDLEIIFDESEPENEKQEEKRPTKDLKLLRKNFLDNLSNKK